MRSFTRFFQIDAPFGQLLCRVLDLFCLSLLWAALCLTIVGIGPATTALYYCVQHCIRTEDRPLLPTFLHALKDGWQQSLPAGLLMALFTAAFWFTDVPVLLLALQDLPGHLNAFTAIAAAKYLLLLWIWLYVFQILAQYRIRLAGAFFQGLILAFSHFGKTLLMTGIATAAVFAIARYPLLITIVPGGCAYLFSHHTQDPLAAIAPKEQSLDPCPQ